MSATMEDLRQAGLCDGVEQPQLTAKGREWLRLLEDVHTQEERAVGEAAADLVLSTSGLIR